jgi:excisionase family DNA binding protein
MAGNPPLGRLKQALAKQRDALEDLESALLEFEETLDGRVLDRPQSTDDFELLSIVQVCQRLSMGKSWVYRRIKEGEIPSVKLGRTIKIDKDQAIRPGRLPRGAPLPAIGQGLDLFSRSPGTVPRKRLLESVSDPFVRSMPHALVASLFRVPGPPIARQDL